MCWVGMVAQLGLQAMGMRQQYSSQAKMLEAQARGATKEMNYAFQNYEQERQDSFDAAVNDITKTRINQMQLNSQVHAAIAEGYSGGGRTANRLMRAAEADTSRTISSIQDNYMRKSNEIDLNKESTALSTKDYINNLIEQGKISKKQKFADILGLAGTALSGYSKYRDLRLASEDKGGSWNFWKGAVSSTKKLKVTPMAFDTWGLGATSEYERMKYNGGF